MLPVAAQAASGEMSLACPPVGWKSRVLSRRSESLPMVAHKCPFSWQTRMARQLPVLLEMSRGWAGARAPGPLAVEE
eukprot:5863537-Heterocapsa_arctica.AAC.1